MDKMNLVLENERLKIYETQIEGLFVLEQHRFEDLRGSVRDLRFPELSKFLGFEIVVKQMIHSSSQTNVIRGMHGEGMWKIVIPVTGLFRFSWVDSRKISPSFGTIQTLDFEAGSYSFFVPEGVLNGFWVKSGIGNVMYLVEKTSLEIDKSTQVAINPMGTFQNGTKLFEEATNPIISERDSNQSISWEEYVNR